MYKYLLLLASAISADCNETPPIFKLAVSCPSRSGFMKRFSFAAKKDSVSVATCEQSVDSKSVKIHSNSIIIENLCDRAVLANLDEVSCESVSGILGSVA